MPSMSICGTNILSPPDPATDRDGLRTHPRLPLHNGDPGFAEPWQAHAFALAIKLSEQGHFTWKEWATALACELKSAADLGGPDDGSRYYHHWLAALENLVTAKGLTDATTLTARKHAWEDAYRHTPHGSPVELAGPQSRQEV
jgi:nitrile hydratase accessory protein